MSLSLSGVIVDVAVQFLRAYGRLVGVRRNVGSILGQEINIIVWLQQSKLTRWCRRHDCLLRLVGSGKVTS